MELQNPELLKEQLNEAKFAELSVEEIEGKQVFVATDETIDREGEIISIDGWDLANFKRNPILLWSHNPFEPMIGRANNIRMRSMGGKKKLTFEPEFHRKTELSQSIADLVEGGWMKTVSVGFRPFQKEGNKYTKQEMLEISFVNIPANPEATQLAYSKGYSPETMTKLFGEEVEKATDTTESDEVEEVITDTKPVQNPEETHTDSESLKSLAQRVSDLEVAVKAAKPEPLLASVPSKGRSGRNGSRKNRIRRALQVADKAIELVLREIKMKG